MDFLGTRDTGESYSGKRDSDFTKLVHDSP